ncbi:MAG: hypothetical protein BGO38_00995 [Cellulomonas sp. 73-145]|nr:MAG: hypothetical protein BGO38_00995 [Cellulomonas sp. 73-145]
MYGQPNPYGEAPVSGQAQPGQQPAYGQEPYGAAQPYGPAASYGPAPVYGQQAVYGQQPVYGQQAVYGQQPVYAPPGQVPTYGPYGYPTAQPYGPPGGWDTPKTDSMSIAALVVALSGFLFGLTFPVGLGLGIAGMVRTKRRQLEGRGLAIAAVVVGALGTLLLIGFIVLIAVLGSTGGFDDSASSSTSSGPLHSGSASGTTLPQYRLVQGLTPGECLQGDSSSWSLADAVAVACTAPHNLEVVSVYKLAERPVNSTDEPGPELDKALSTCEDDVLAANSALLGEDDWSDVWAPHPDQWDAGETSAYCLWGTDSSVTGSATQGFGAQSSNL